MHYLHVHWPNDHRPLYALFLAVLYFYIFKYLYLFKPHTLPLDDTGSVPSYGAMVERRDGPSWLRDDDDDNDDFATGIKTKWLGRLQSGRWTLLRCNT